MNVETLLAAQPLGADVFGGAAAGTDEHRTYGGLLVAQALAASAATADDRPCHSLHMLFLEAGDNSNGVTSSVERVRDGRSFSARKVTVLQEGRLLAAGFASFHRGDSGPEHQVNMPDVPAAEQLEDQREIRRRSAATRGTPMRRYIAEALLDQRLVATAVDTKRGVEGQRIAWFKSREPLGDSLCLHQAVLAFASDMGLVHVGVSVENQIGQRLRLDAASLDHAIWFHRAARCDGWLLYVQRAPVMVNGRGLSQGTIFDREGRMVASVAQEFLAREKRE